MRSWTWLLSSLAMLGCGALPEPLLPDAGSGGGGGGSAAGGAGGEATAGGSGGGLGAAGGSAGGGTAGGSSAGGGSGGGLPNGPGCPSPTRCLDGTGQGDFVCLDPTTASGIPASAPSCSQTVACPSGWGCFLTTTGATTGVCLKNCQGGAGGGSAAGGGTGTGGAAGGAVASLPSFAGAGTEVAITDAGTLALPAPSSPQTGDLWLAIIDADESAGQLALTAPAGWTLLGGWPIHNLNTDHSPYIIPASYNHGFWIYRAWSTGTQPLSADFVFDRPATARGVVVSYRDVNSVTPINDKTGYGLYGNGNSNGFGSGNTTLDRGLEVGIVATSPTPWAHSIAFTPGFGEAVRVNSGEQPLGLELLVVDQPISQRVYTGVMATFKRAPSNLSTSLMYGIATLVLKPR